MIIKHTLYGLILFILSSEGFAQNNSTWVKRFDIELKYSNVNTWRRVMDSDGDVLKDDDGKSYGLGINYNVNEKLFIQANYHRSTLYNVDLESQFNLGSFSTYVGRKFKILEKVRFDFKGGFSIYTYPLYETWVTTGMIGNQVVSRNVQRVLNGVGTFSYWSMGLSAAYPISNELSFGGEVNWNYSLASEKGVTASGVFLRMKLFN